MPGPPPKDPKTRQRRNKPPTAGNLPPGKRALQYDKKGNPKRPALPNRGPGKAWHPRTKAWWEHVWSSPMATQYLEVELDGLIALAELVDARNQIPAYEPLRLKIDAEIRMQARDYGLTPMDRRRLGWTIGDDEPEKPSADDEDADEAGQADPRDVLRLVQ